MPMKSNRIVCDTITVRDRIIFEGASPIIEISGLKNATKLQIVDKDRVVSHELILNTTDGTSGEIRAKAVKKI